MAIKIKDGYKCFYCNKKYTHPEKADQCREGHQLVYVPISVSELNKLLHYIMFPDSEILEGTQIARMLQTTLKKKTISMAQERKDSGKETH